MTYDSKQVTLAGLANLFIIYIAWGSTYLAIRVAVRDGSGIEPFMLGATRTLVAGSFLVAMTALLRWRLKPSRQELFVLATSGLLLWLGGNGLVNYAEQYIDSGLAALLVGTMPIMVAGMEAIIDRRMPSPLLAGSLLLGFAGLATLVWPVLRQGAEGDVKAVIAMVVGPLSWGAGSILLARRPVNMSPFTISGYQQLFGSVFFWLVALALGEPLMNPTPEAWAAWGYLLVVGSIVAISAYMNALKLLPTSLVMTYPYVNPVIAVFLGWFLLHEGISWWTITGAAMVMLGVAGVFRAKGKRVRRVPGPR